MPTERNKNKDKKGATINVEQWFFLLFAVLMYLFWRFAGQSLLSYHEQLQLFLWTPDYMVERLQLPGGLVIFCSEFIVQFYNNFNIGALLLTLLFVGFLYIASDVIKRHASSKAPATALVPTLMLIVASCNSDVMTSVVMAFVVVMLLIKFLPREGLYRHLYVCIVATLGYVAVGPLVVFMLLYVVVDGLCRDNVRQIDTAFNIAGIVLMALSVYVASLLVPYGLDDLMRGLGYWRNGEVSWMCCGIGLFIVLMPLLRYVSTKQRLLAVMSFGAVACLTVAIFITHNSADMQRLEYVLLTRTNRWNTIIEKSGGRLSDDPTEYAATLLAQWKTGKIESQRLVSALSQRKDFNSLTYLSVLSDIYFNIGLVNASQRFAFELKELIPNHNCSGRILSRLAETALVSGRKELARRYIAILKYAPFYRYKAEQLEELLLDDETLQRHKTYGPLSKSFPENDVMF